MGTRESEKGKEKEKENKVSNVVPGGHQSPWSMHGRKRLAGCRTTSRLYDIDTVESQSIWSTEKEFSRKRGFSTSSCFPLRSPDFSTPVIHFKSKTPASQLDDQLTPEIEEMLPGWNKERLLACVVIQLSIEGTQNRLDLKRSTDETVGAAKHAVLEHAREHLKPQTNILGDEAYIVKPVGFDFCFTREDLPLKRLQFLQSCKKAFVPATLQIVAKSSLPEAVLTAKEPTSMMTKEFHLSNQVGFLLLFF